MFLFNFRVYFNESCQTGCRYKGNVIAEFYQELPPLVVTHLIKSYD
jgi:hypothetical protein